MIRFIIKRRMYDSSTGAREITHETIDHHCPDLERVMAGAAYGSRGYDSRELAGIEILPDPQPASQPADDQELPYGDTPKYPAAADLLRGRATLEG